MKTSFSNEDRYHDMILLNRMENCFEAVKQTLLLTLYDGGNDLQDLQTVMPNDSID